MLTSIPIISFVGYSGSGKTTLLTKVIEQFKEKGYKLATIKHDAHRFNIDHEGKDTWKYAQAGSDVVIINSNEKLAYIEKLQNPIPFEQVISKIEGVDIIFVEGYKHEFPPKILVVRRESDIKLLPELHDVVAIASSLPLTDQKIPIYSLNDVESIVSFIESELLGESYHGRRK